MTPAVLTAHKPLNSQCQKVLRYMVERGGISRREAMDLNVLNLPARILDLREAFGDDAVRTTMHPPDGEVQHAVYVWAATSERQGELPL